MQQNFVTYALVRASSSTETYPSFVHNTLFYQIRRKNENNEDGDLERKFSWILNLETDVVFMAATSISLQCGKNYWFVQFSFFFGDERVCPLF